MIYNYFEKGCRKKCTRKSRKVLWVALRALFFKKLERMVRKATDICLRVRKESNKSRFDSFTRYEQCIDHIPYYLSGLSRAHFFRRPVSKQLYINNVHFDKVSIVNAPVLFSFSSLQESKFLFATKSKHWLIFKQITKGTKIYSEKLQFTNGHK